MVNGNTDMAQTLKKVIACFILNALCDTFVIAVKRTKPSIY